MRLIPLLVCFPALVAGQDARDIVRRSLEADRKNDLIARQYTYLQRQETRTLDGSSAVKNRTVVTYDVTLLEGSPYRRLVGRNDQPLPPEEQQREEEKLRRSIEERSKQTAEERKLRLEDAERRRLRRLEQIQEVPEAFDFTLAGAARVDGYEVWVIDAVPRPGYKSKTPASRILTKVKGRMWIAKQDYEWVKADVETLDTITFGGFLLRLAKGGRLELDQTRVNGEVWLPRHITITASARIFLIKGVRLDMEYGFSGYKKFRVESRVVNGGQ